MSLQAGGVHEMTVEQGLRLIAGVFVAATAALAAFHSPYWLIFTGIIGLNLFQSAFTNWCPMVWVLQKAGLKKCVPERESS